MLAHWALSNGIAIGDNFSGSGVRKCRTAEAFYDAQGDLWITKNGYYLVVSWRQTFREPVARLIAGKL